MTKLANLLFKRHLGKRIKIDHHPYAFPDRRWRIMLLYNPQETKNNPKNDNDNYESQAAIDFAEDFCLLLLAFHYC